MSARWRGIAISAVLALLANAAGAQGTSAPCPVDSVPAGTICLDKFEASVWRVPNPTTTNAALVTKIQSGTATAADLTAGGATQLGVGSDNYAPCNDIGQNCASDIYALSLPSVTPAGFATWFQALEACADSEKRLPTSAEWQVGADGTPDPGPDNGTTDCNSAATGAPSLTGARSSCVSARGAFDMVGNLYEWVADWVTRSSLGCPQWASFSNDEMCLAGASTTALGAGALIRGGTFEHGSFAGPLAVDGQFEATRSVDAIGFRCARPLPEPGSAASLYIGAAGLAWLARRRARSKRCGPTRIEL
jgi:Sulfatase-modifying factor enzyme 1